MKLYRVNALLLKYYYITKNRLDRLFDVIYWPVLGLLIWAFASLFIEDLSGVNVKSMIFGGVILFVFVWRSAQDITIYILEDFWSRNLYNLFTSPVRASEIALSVIIFGLLRSVVTFALLSVLAILIFSFNIFTINLFYLALFISGLVLFSWVLGLFISSVIFRYGSRIQVFAWSVVFLIEPFSCVFYPLSILPNWAQKVAVLLPTTYIFESFRATLNNTAIAWGNIVFSFFTSLLLLILVGLFFKSSIKKAIKIGLFAKYD